MTHSRIIVKKHISQEGKLILAACDEDLIGKEFEKNNKHLDLGSDFYKGGIKSEEEVISLLKKAYIINAVGKNSVRCCLKAGLIEDGPIQKIANIPYLNLVFI